MDNKQLAIEILQLAGGKENILGCTHCVTRLRLTVKNIDKINSASIQALEGVMGTNLVGSQLQVILGGRVVPVYDEVAMLVEDNLKNTNEQTTSGNILDRFLDTLSGIFVPVIPAIIGAGLLKAILYTLMFAKVISTDSTIFQFLNVFSDAGFYFLPILLAFSAATKFKANPYVATVIAGILIHPELISMMSKSTTLNFLGIPIVSMSYASSVIPIVLGIWFMSYVEKGLNKIVPKILQTVLLPLLTLIITTPVVLAVIGPVGKLIGDAIGNGFIALYMSPFSVIAGMIFGAVFPYLIMVGMHNGLAPIMMQTLSKYGVDYLMGLNVAANSAQAGATFAVFLKTKNKEFKSLAGVAALNAILGITEPALFGVTSRLKKPLLAVSIGGAVGGGIAAFFRVEALGIATGPIIGIPLFIGPTFIYFIISCIVAFIIAFIATNIIGFEDIPEKTTPVQTAESEESLLINIVSNEMITSPIEGKVLPLEEVKDNVFAQKIMGDGIAIDPTVGSVVAPFDGLVEVAFETQHAIGLKSFDGCELLIHVGLDTVELNGKGYTSHIKKGDTITKGDVLLEFDIQAIKQAGYDVTTPIIVTNSSMYQKITKTTQDKIKIGNDLLELMVK